MNFARALGDAVVNSPERHSARWWASRVVPPTAVTVEFIMAVATLLRYTELGQVGQLLVAANFLDRAVSATHIDPAVTLAALTITHIGGNRIMALLEVLMRPLLNAQRKAGREEGEAAAEAQFEAWKARQRAAGVEFVDDEQREDRPAPTEIDQ